MLTKRSPLPTPLAIVLAYAKVLCDSAISTATNPHRFDTPVRP
jgi:hypothetical protein